MDEITPQIIISYGVTPIKAEFLRDCVARAKKESETKKIVEKVSLVRKAALKAAEDGYDILRIECDEKSVTDHINGNYVYLTIKEKDIDRLIKCLEQVFVGARISCYNTVNLSVDWS